MRLYFESRNGSAEVQPYLRDLFNRLAIEPGRLELIVHHRVKCGVPENRRTGYKARAGNLAIFAHFHFNHHHAGDIAGLGDCGIDQRRGFDQLQRLKLRLLNGAHTILASMGLLAGERHVGEAMSSDVGAVVRRAMLDEIAPYVDAPGAAAYAHDVLDRFNNPGIRHALRDIMLQATTKMRVRVVPSIVAYANAVHTAPPALTLGFASLLLNLRGEAAPGLPPDDQADRIRRVWNRHGDASDAVVSEVAADVALWETDLNRLPGFTALAAALLAIAARDGLRAAMERVDSERHLVTVAGNV